MQGRNMMPYQAGTMSTSASTVSLARSLINAFIHYFSVRDIRPVIHFELEGGLEFPAAHKQPKLNFKAVNDMLAQRNILGELKEEYWQNQWEYVSKFCGQSPLKEANDLAQVINELPHILARVGVQKTLIKPVIWTGDKGQLANGCKNIFSLNARAVHIPNAIQINVSAVNSLGNNLVPVDGFGELLQQQFLQTSLACCLLYMPEEEAFERMQLKTRYGLEEELCSPNDISGGHQGSVALYKQQGKHNQPMGLEPLLFDSNNKALVNKQDWHATARVEHRLGASSTLYDAHANVIYALANLAQAFEQWQLGQRCTTQETSQQLPLSLYASSQCQGAIALFESDTWFASVINRVVDEVKKQSVDEKITSLPHNSGDLLKRAIMARYQKQLII